MKKILLTTIFILLSISSNAQFRTFHTRSLLPKVAYKSDISTFGAGLDFRFMIANSIRLAADATYYIPKNHTMGLDAGVNFHYLTTMIPDQFICYPMVGCVVANNFTEKINVTSQTSIPASTKTEVGFSVGVGGELSVGTFNDKNYVSLELKYIFAKNSFIVGTLGYGIRF